MGLQGQVLSEMAIDEVQATVHLHNPLHVVLWKLGRVFDNIRLWLQGLLVKTNVRLVKEGSLTASEGGEQCLFSIPLTERGPLVRIHSPKRCFSLGQSQTRTQMAHCFGCCPHLCLTWIL